MRVITECRTSTRTHNLFECEMTNYLINTVTRLKGRHMGELNKQTHTVYVHVVLAPTAPSSSSSSILLCPFLRVGICCWLPILTPFGYIPTDCSMFFYSPDCSSDPSSRFSRGGNLGDILIPNTGRNAEQRPNDHNPTSHSRVYIWSNVPGHDKWLSGQGFLRGMER